VYCDNAHVKATGGCESTKCTAEEIHAAMTGGERHYPTGSGRVYPWVTETMYHYEFSKVSKGKETLNCPDRSSGTWEVHCDNGEVKASGECEVTSFYGWAPYQTESPYAEIKVSRDGKCMDALDHSHEVYMHPCTGGSSQMWHFDSWGRIISQRTGKCLDYDLGNKRVNQYHCHSNNNQKWHFDPDGHLGTAHDDLCLDYDSHGSGRDLRMEPCHGDSNQVYDHPQREENEKVVRMAR